MSHADRYGLALSTASLAAVERYQAGMDRLLSYGYGADQAFAEAAAADDGLALAHAGTALFALTQGDGAGARAAIGAARERVAGASRRERQHVEALSALVAGDTARGLALVDEHVADFPRDALLVNQPSSAIGFAGRADREAHRMAFMERLAPAYGEDWWYLSALAFTYHEMRRFDESRELSERSLAKFPANAHASHNLAHVWFEAGHHDDGIAFLESWIAGYDRRSPFHCHLAWHLALFELHRGNAARAMEIHERDIARSSNGRLAVMDGAALLWRLLLYGAHEGPLPWRAIADIAARVSRPGFVFGEIHAALAYAASGDEPGLSAVIDGLRALDAKGHPIAGRVALPLVQGIAAFVAGDHAAALAHIEPVDAEIHRMGGSHAQWELFEETMVVCQLRVGRHEDAARLIRRRLGIRPSARDRAWLETAAAGGRSFRG